MYIMTILQLSIIIFITSLSRRLYNNNRRLKSFPGPFLASLTDLWFFTQQRLGKSWNTILAELHETYGPVVRLGPGRLSFTNPAAIASIYGFHPLLVKPSHSNNYASLTKISNGQEVISFNTLVDEKRHTAIKKYIGASFLPRALADYEPSVDENIALLVQKLGDLVEVDAAEWMEFFTTDTICRIAFDEDARCVTTGSDDTGFIAAATDRLRHWTLWSVLPDSDRVIFRNPLITALLQSTSQIAAMAAKKMKHAREAGSKDHNLTARFLAASDENPQAVRPRDVIALVMSVLTAGATTTGNTAALVLYHLASNPTALTSLVRELEEGGATGALSFPARFEELNKLKYLDAVIHESMRLTPTTDHGIWRVAPLGGIEVAGVYVPAGTVMEVPISLVQRDQGVYGEDSSHFRPERWIDASDEQKGLMDKTWLAFGAGKRLCLGQHIAMLELKKLIPKLMMEFEMSLVNPDKSLKMTGMFVSRPIGLRMHFSAKAALRHASAD